MFIELTPEQRALQAELRQYFSTLITPDEAKAMQSDRHNEAYRAVIKRMGSDGKLGVGWPTEYGGLGFGPIEQQIFVNEANRADIPLPLVTLQTVGPTLQVYGTEEQKKKFLPGILSGDIHFAIGYSEPDPGTDLASLRWINELLNWQVAASGETIAVADAAATKVFCTERIQEVGRLAEELVARYGNPADPDTAELLEWLDMMAKRNLVITFGGGVNEVMREMIAASGLGVPRVSR